MIFTPKTRKKVAVFLALNMLVEVISPNLAKALTGGPSQPEVDSFEPVNTTQMVDLFSGDFNYNIPLLDVGGYPVNIAYHAGIGMEQEASWVGLGWNINVGNITRNMRGIPDDFNGDQIIKEFKMKPNTTIGADAKANLQVFGMTKGKIDEFNKKVEDAQNDEYQLENLWDDLKESNFSDTGKIGKFINLYKTITQLSGEIKDLAPSIEKGMKNLNSLSKWDVNLGVYHNSYKGWGISTGITFTAFQSANHVHVPLGIGFNSQTGSEVNASLVVGQYLNKYEGAGWQGSIGLGYNSLDGLKSVSFSSSYNSVMDAKSDRMTGTYERSSTVAIGLVSYTPSFQFAMKNHSYDMHVTLGGELTGLHGNITLSGSYAKQELAYTTKKYQAYGYLFDQDKVKNISEDGYDDLMLDFNRFNDRSFDKFLTNLPASTGTYDVFSIQGQGTGGSFRPHRNSAGIYFDPTVESKPAFNQLDIGAEFGAGINVHFGVPIKAGGSTSKSGVWWKDNELFTNFYNPGSGEAYEDVYFRAAGDGGPVDENNFLKFGGDEPARFQLEKTGLARLFRNFAKLVKNKLRVETKGSNATWWDVTVPSAKTAKRVSRNSTISYLTNKEAQFGMGMDEDRFSYPTRFWEGGAVAGRTIYARFGTDFRSPKEYHIGEITQTNPDGTRYIYGLPQINNYQKEVMFNIGQVKEGSHHYNKTEAEKELAAYKAGEDDSRSNRRGPDYFYQGTIMPAYAHSYLLTEVLSPDYVDVTGDGVSNDDLGTAIKFNYARTTGNYKWRTPYEKNRGRYNAGYLCDSSDDKASYIYGEKELWYLHSIESKTHVAVFKMSARSDGYGVKDTAGGLDTATNNQMMKLDSIVLYSKLDLFTNGANATPVKTIVFKYSYDLCKDIPNHKSYVSGSSTNKGKLTLKEIYFTYGKNNRGSISPYKFTYSNSNPKYSLAQFDCWGNYKPTTRGVPNREFPFTDALSDSTVHDTAAMAWSLQKIELPSGGKINVEYEADDYAYVQDKKAMEMLMIEGMAADDKGFHNNTGGNTIYDPKRANNTYLYFKNPDRDKITTEQRAKDALFRDEQGNYLAQLYYRVKVNMNPRGDSKNAWEYVSGWAAIETTNGDWDQFNPMVGLKDSFIWVKLREVRQGDVGISKTHPIAKAAWQLALQDLRDIVFPGSAPNQTGKSAFTGLLNALGTTLNIFTGPYQNLRWKKIASVFQPLHSYLRVYHHNQFKKGGGLRVKKLYLQDNWDNMSTGQSGASYGQVFSYRTKDHNGKDISSGVASWEPQMGGDQNPFRQPIFNVQKIPIGPNRKLFQTKPFLEQLYPGALVGYSKVKVTSIGNASSPRSSTGFTINEFYTAKDFPVREEFTDLQRLKNGPGIFKFLKKAILPVVKDAQAASQGYVLELNDMHGKPKSVKTYGEMEGGTINLIAGNEYIYQTKKNDTARLDNHVSVLNDSGRIQKAEISQEYDVNYDLRKSYTNGWHGGTKLGFDNTWVFLVPHAIPKFKKQITMLQTSVVCKIIQRYGIIKAVKAFDYGSEVTTENLLWDKETGSVLLTRTTNEFNDNIYNFSYPAHVAYDRMGPAYKNLDYEQTGMLIGPRGMCAVSNTENYVPGDELLLTDAKGSFSRAWVLKSGSGKIKVIDRTGFPAPEGYYTIRIIRSGRRNMQSTPVGAITTMHNPMNLSTRKMELDQKIVNTSAVEYSEDWPGDVNAGYYFTRTCDTIDPAQQLVLVTAYLRKLYSIDSVYRYLYGTSGVPNPYPLSLDSTFAWFDTSTLKLFIDSVFLSNIPDSCERQYFLGRSSSISTTLDSFGIQVRYRCNPEMDWIYINPCRFMQANGMWSGFGAIDHVHVYYSSSGLIDHSTVYDVSGDSTSFDVSLRCFNRLIRCHNTQTCVYTLGDVFNPYVNGMRGIWRPRKTWAFVGARQYNFVKDTSDIRHEGIIKDYVPFWTYGDTLDGLYPTGKTNKKWVNSTTATMFSAKGNGLEEVDALGIYKSQLFGYDQTLVTAVAANAKYKQIAFDNFEDYNYTIGTCEVPGHLDFRERMSSSYQWITLGNGRTKLRNFTNPSSNVYIRKDTAHSGLYSIALKPSISHYATRIIDTSFIVKSSPSDTGLFRNNAVKNTVPLFQPDGGQKYVLSAWVTEDIANKNTVNTFSNAKINVKVYDGASVQSLDFTASGMIIEGWQRVQGVFTIASGADSIRITLVNGSSTTKAGFDDIRINPFNSSMKSYVFNPVLLKIMAELDDNNYTTFYEYDAEGSLVRVKRETERGKMTVQENRKGIMKTR